MTPLRLAFISIVKFLAIFIESAPATPRGQSAANNFLQDEIVSKSRSNQFQGSDLAARAFRIASLRQLTHKHPL